MSLRSNLPPSRRAARCLVGLLASLALSGCQGDRLKARWRADTHAPFGESFVVAGDAVVVTDVSDDREDVLRCFALADGAARWQVPLGEGFIVGSALGPILLGADPDGAAVYAAQGTWAASFSVADGALRWGGQVPPQEPFEAYARGLRVVGERLYLISRDSRLVAIDRRTGEMVFRTDDQEDAWDLKVRDGAVITRSNETSDVRAHDAQTGAPLWQRVLAARSPISNRLEKSIELAPDRGAYLVVDGERALLALDPRTGAVRWVQPVVGLASFAWAGDGVVVGDSASVRGLDPATGAVRWSRPTGGLSLVAPLDDKTALLVLSTSVSTVEARTGSVHKRGRINSLHEQDQVIDARAGLVVFTTDNGVARLYQHERPRLFRLSIASLLAHVFRPGRHGVTQAAIAGRGAVTFNTAHEVERFAR
jgi:outer membrane protein assembly factor BamB